MALFSCLTLFAQPQVSRCSNISVFQSSTQIQNPWAGGLNFTEWSRCDLDMDGFKDLVVFDKTGSKIRVFKNDGLAGIASYHHDANLQSAFPPSVNSWMLMYDYNCDGKEDIFTYSLGMGGIKVFKNTSTVGNPSFSLEKSLILSNYNPSGAPAWINLYCSNVALPGMADVDNDGDMDILSFSSIGIKIEYHKNMSKELYGNCDSLVFHMVDACWGDIQESSCSAQMNVCPYPRIYEEAIGNLSPDKNNLHSGSCIMCFDADGDADQDLILGDISCDSIDFMTNGGSPTNNHITSLSKSYPASQAIGMKTFPCTYFLDVDNDGKRDLIASPNTTTAGSNFTSVSFYKNTNTDNVPQFSFVQNDFLQNEMIDLGEGAYPAYFDYEGDGDMDLLIGNFGYYIYPNYNSKLAFFENTGSASLPVFSLVTNDFQSLSSNNIVNMAPTFGDLDGDGDIDLMVGGYDGKLTYFQNTAGAGNPASYTIAGSFAFGCVSGIDVGQIAYPHIVDLDRDGLLDMIIGEYDGTLNYYRNTGSTNAPAFTLVAANLGGVNVCEEGWVIGHSIPFVFDEGGQYKLLVGCERGYIYVFGNIDGNLGGNFALIDSIGFNDVIEGAHTAPLLYDFDADGIRDLIIGNFSGGLGYFCGTSNVAVTNNKQSLNFNVFPNPAANNFQVDFDPYDLNKKQLLLYDVCGKLVMSEFTRSNSFKFNCESLQSGVYILKCISTESITIYENKKIIIQKNEN